MVSEQEEYNQWLSDVSNGKVFVTLDSYRRWAAYDSNIQWRLGPGIINNLLDDAIDIVEEWERRYE